MSLLDELCSHSMKLIEGYIGENQIYTSEQCAVSISARWTASLCWLFGQKEELKKQKVTSAQKFLELLRIEIKTNYSASSVSTLEPTLKIIQEKIKTEIDSITLIRLQYNAAPSSYDARLNIFAKLISYTLEPEQLKSMSFAVILEKNEATSNITKVLLLLENILLKVKFDSFLASEPVLRAPITFIMNHGEFILNELMNNIAVLAEKRQNKNTLNPSVERNFLIGQLNGLMHELRDKTRSSGIKEIISKLEAMTATLKTEEISYKREQSQQKLRITTA